MRRLHATLMVLGTAAITLGALACTHDVATGPSRIAGPSFAKNPAAPGKIRTFHGKKASYDIDHDRSVIVDKATGKVAKLDAKSLAVLEKGFDGLDAMDRKLAD